MPQDGVDSALADTSTVLPVSPQQKVAHLQEELTTLRGWGKEQKEAQIDQVTTFFWVLLLALAFG